MKKYKLEIFSDFGQIQIYDEDWDDDNELDWSDIDLENFVCVGTNVLGLGVIENDDHVLNVVLHDEPPVLDMDNWDHVVDAPFEAPTGNIDIADESLEIPAGKYIFRWSIKNIGDGRGQYHLDLWQGDIKKVEVHKRLARN